MMETSFTRKLSLKITPLIFIVITLAITALFLSYIHSLWLRAFFALNQHQDVLNDQNIKMDDPALLDAVRKLILPPPILSYNLDDMKYLSGDLNPSKGQTQAVADILKSFGGNGFFIDCGANNGEHQSNTLWIERKLGWKGLLIEANPAVFSKLGTKHRNAWTANFCLSNLTYPSNMPFYKHSGYDTMGGIVKLLNRSYSSDILKVQCLPLYTVLLAVNHTTVDFFSLDIEGNELNVLRTVPFDKIIFKVITVEHINIQEGKAALREFMESKSYVLHRNIEHPRRLAGDSIFIHKSVASKLKSKQMKTKSG